MNAENFTQLDQEVEKNEIIRKFPNGRIGTKI